MTAITGFSEPDARVSSDNTNSNVQAEERAVYRSDVLKVVESTIDRLSSELRELSLDIHSHPEVMFKERHAHDVLTSFMDAHGFDVTRHYGLDTAWRATFTHGRGVSRIRTIGVNSEMDALPGIGHACGHNLIAIAGVAVAIGIKAALETLDIPGHVVLLGTPAEEGGEGKQFLLDQGAYKGMDACLMCHPAPGPAESVSLSSSLAIQRIEVEYTGHSAHAALSPWEGKNALDACVLAYNNISALRQQLKPTHRVHGIFEGHNWAANIIPDNSKMHWLVRAPTWAEVETAKTRVMACFEAAAIATGCKVSIKPIGGLTELRQNKTLGDEIARIVRSRHGSVNYAYGIENASTDFGNVSYALPSLHPGYAIPTVTDGGNHTPAFTDAARTIEAHKATLEVAKALAAVGVRVLDDEAFSRDVKRAFDGGLVAAER